MLLLKNGVLATMDSAQPLAEAAVVSGPYFAYVGDSASAEAFARRYAGGSLETVDLEGRFLMPGFHDSHMHLLHLVKRRLAVDLSGADSLSAVLDRLRGGLEGLPPGQWLIGEGWDQERFTGERRLPTCRDLDRVSTRVPILILRSCCHVGTVNSRAMELLRLTRETVDALGPFAGRDGDGAPNGILRENVLDDIKAGLPSTGLDALMEQLLQLQGDLFAQGLTSVQSDDFKYAPDGQPYALMDRLRALAESGRLKLRMGEQALLTEQEALDEFFARGGGVFGGGCRFRISAVKILADGSLGARTAWLQAPYADAPGERGLPIYPDQGVLDRLVRTAQLHNLPVAIHAIGDGGAEAALTAIRRAQEAVPWFSPRHGLVHCQVMSPEQLRRMRALGTAALVQPVFISGDMHIAPARLGPERLASSYAWGDMARLGIPLAFGTDCPVEHFRPMEGIYCAVTRRDLSGRGPFLPGQALTPMQALAAYTAGSAYAAGEEGYKGQLRPGQLADFIVLDRNPLECPPEAILESQVLCTYVGGQCVYKAD